MRKLLVISHGDLPDDIVGLLARKHWSLSYARDTETARGLIAKHHCMVGLVAFSDARDPETERQLQETVVSLPDLKWVAALAEGQIDNHDFKHFVAERLYDFHVFPIDGERLATVLGHAYGMARIEHELKQKRVSRFPTRFGLIGESNVMLSLHRMLQRAAESDVSVLITGPTGTGKELAARAIHDHSARAKGPYVAINCAAIPPTLLQSELFGHEKGSFTNATTRKTGYIQGATGGTLFLDEIGDMPLESQASLLRFLEDKIVTPIGSTRGQHVNVRVIASTNIDLEAAIQEKTFRADLYYRLAFLTIQTPGLNTREDDIELLAQAFLDEVTTDAGTRNLKFTQESLQIMRRYVWPGNVRELRSVVFQAALGCEGLYIRPENLKIRIDPELFESETLKNARDQADRRNGGSAGPYVSGTLKSAREQSEKRNLEFALARNASNITRAARDLGVSRMTLYRLMAKHGVARTAN